MARENQNIGNVRETFFLNQLKANYKVVSSKNVDFKIDNSEFEVGGKSKGLKQIKNLPNAFIIRDDIESGFLNTIPLWHFGLMY